MTRATWVRIGVGIVVVVTVVFFVLALIDARGEIESWPPVATLVGAGAVWGVGLVIASLGWARLLGPPDSIRHAAAFLVSQIGKYVPGGVGQVAGQVGLARSAGVPLRRGIAALAALGVTQVGAGASSLVVLAASWSETETWVRIVLVIGGVMGTALAVERRWMLWLLSRIPRFNDSANELIPGVGAIRVAWFTSLSSLVCAAVVYTIVLNSLTPVADPVLVASAFVAAWTAGFLVLPLPSGLGVREAVLVGILATAGYSGAIVLAASVIQRLVSMLAEGGVAAGATVLLRRRHIPTPFEVTPEDAPLET